MAALNFPSSPTVGASYTANGKSWLWDGTRWVPDLTNYSTGMLPLMTNKSGQFLTNNGTVSNWIAAIQEHKIAMAANDIDVSLGNYFTKTFTAGAVSLTLSNVPASGTVAAGILEATNAGLATITYPSGSKWAGGTAPTLSSAGKDILGWYTHDGGTTINWLVLGKDVK